MNDTTSAGDTGQVDALRPNDPDRRQVRRGGPRPLAAVDDAALVGLVQRGSQIAWDELVRRFTGLVAAVAHSHGMSAHDAADVAQITWLQLYRHVGGLRRPERIAGWLATTARRECLRIIGDSHDAVRSRREDGPPTPDPGPLDSLIADERRAAVGQALAHIPHRSRRLLELLVWDERSYREVSTEMGIPIGAIGPTRARTLQRLARRPEVVRLESERPGAA